MSDNRAMRPRERAQANAALIMIHQAGHDAKAVMAHARQLQDSGRFPGAYAYREALKVFERAHPAVSPSIRQAVKLVYHSDDATVAQYDAALSSYIETGDGSAVAALAPMIAADSMELARRDGTPIADVASAFGFETVEQLQETAGMHATTPQAPSYAKQVSAEGATSPAPAPATAEQQQPAPAKVQFTFRHNTNPMALGAAPVNSFNTDTRFAAPPTPAPAAGRRALTAQELNAHMGTVAPRAAARWDRDNANAEAFGLAHSADPFLSREDAMAKVMNSGTRILSTDE